MTPRFAVILFALPFATGTYACRGGAGAPSTPESGAPAEIPIANASAAPTATGTPPAPLRAASHSCRATNPPKGAVSHNGPKGDPEHDLPGCKSDAECTKPGGRCITVHAHPRDTRPTNKCTDDQCKTDADCGQGRVCSCGTDELTNRNKCVVGNCTSDADCGGFSCARTAAGSYCHSKADACTKDADCTGDGNGKHCKFIGDAFRCGHQSIPRPG